jgi:hypothetical protein
LEHGGSSVVSGGLTGYETMWKNNLSFAKDGPMLYVNCIVTAVILSEKK